MQTTATENSLALRKAANSGDFDKVSAILAENINRHDFDINGTSSNGNTALLWAAEGLLKNLDAINGNRKKALDFIKTVESLHKYKVDFFKTNQAKKSFNDYAKQIHSILLLNIDYWSNEIIVSIPSLAQQLFVNPSEKAENKFPEQMTLLIDYCTILSKLLQVKPTGCELNIPAEIIDSVTSIPNFWQASIGYIKLDPNYDFFTLVKTIKNIIKIYGVPHDKLEANLLDLQLNKINNYLSEYYVTMGNYENAEVYLMRSLSESISDKQGIITHLTIARLKICILSEDLPAETKSELLAISKHNLLIVKEKLKNINSLSIETTLLNFLGDISRVVSSYCEVLFSKIRPEFSSSYQDIRELLKILYEMSLDLNLAFLKIQQTSDNYEYNDQLTKDQIRYLQAGLPMAARVILSQIKTVDGLIKDQQQKIVIQNKKTSLKKSLLQSKSTPSILNKQNQNSKKSEQKPKLVEENDLLTSTKEFEKIESNAVQHNIPLSSDAKPESIQQSNSALATISSAATIAVDKTKQGLQEQSLKKNEKQSSAKHTEPKQDSSIRSIKPTLYSIGSAYIPHNTLAGIIPNRINEHLPKELAKLYNDILKRGKIIGRFGQGIKLVSQQERGSKQLADNYIYKIKDPKIDSRLYGRIATSSELEKLGITTIAPYKKLIIFDLHLDSHKLQANKVLLATNLSKQINI